MMMFIIQWPQLAPTPELKGKPAGNEEIWWLNG